MTEYVYAELGRAGLGNLLFPAVRAAVLSATSGAELLPPRWLVPRAGPYLRRESDKRFYYSLFVRNSPRDVSRRVRLQRSATILSETGQVVREGSRSQTLVVTAGMGNYFEPLLPHRQLARQYIIDICRRKPIIDSVFGSSKYISVHVRRGDFAKTYQHVATRSNTATDIKWFVEQIQRTQRDICIENVLVCSDGTDDELEPILGLPGVKRSGHGSAVDDIFALSRGVRLIGSNSTFTAWATFLGSVPTVVQLGANRYLKGSALVTET